VGLRVHNQSFFATLPRVAEVPGSKMDTKFKRHVHAWQFSCRYWHSRYVVDAPSTLADNPGYRLNPNLSPVIPVKRASRLVPTENNRKTDCPQDRFVTIIEWAIDKDRLLIALSHLYLIH
jgi:hypothetical protein